MLKPKSSPHLFSRPHILQKGLPFPTNQQELLTNSLLYLLKLCNSVKCLQQIHTQMLINSIQKHNFLLSKMVHLRDLPYAFLLFSQIPEPNDFSFNVMIRGLTNTWRKFALALEFYHRMKYSGQKPNNFTYPFVLISCANISSLNEGRAAHSSIFKTGLDSNIHVSNSLITMYSRCGELGCARWLFDEITEKDLVSWNSMISGYTQMGFASEGVGLFRRMMMRGEASEPDEVTLVSILGACASLGDLSLGSWVESLVEEKNLEKSSFLGSALIDMYGKCGVLKSARKVFDGMSKKDVVVWNAMITGYAQNGVSDKAIALFYDMRRAGMEPDKITLTSVLSACASIGALNLGEWVDAYASRKGFHQDVYVGTGLIDMYAKCGSLDQALQIFEDMHQKNEVSWNAVISALASHGRAREAILLFERMLKEGGAVCPNGITFIGLLSACVHAGLVDEGCRWFDSMGPQFGLAPKIEHYSCMVDLLARAGHLHEAWEFIEKMPEKPDAVVLGALLGACRKLRNVEVGERVIQLLLEIEPLNSWNYVISSKLYAGLKRWDDSARMRALMRERGVTKTPGCSWIEIESQTHEFHSGDDFDPRSKEIYLTVSLINEEMKMEDYASELSLL